MSKSKDGNCDVRLLLGDEVPLLSCNLPAPCSFHKGVFKMMSQTRRVELINYLSVPNHEERQEAPLVKRVVNR